MVVFKQVNSSKDGSFNEAMQIYTNAFPANERQPLAVIKQRVDEGLSTLFIGCIKKEVIMLALLFNLKNQHFILLDYLAVKEVFQSAGIGSAFLSFIKIYIQKINKHLMIETESRLWKQ